MIQIYYNKLQLKKQMYRKTMWEQAYETRGQTVRQHNLQLFHCVGIKRLRKKLY